MSDKLMLAKLRAIDEWPYYAHALFALRPHPTPKMMEKSMGPIGVDEGWNLYYDPEFIEKTPVLEMAACLIHEVNHLIRDHAQRCRSMSAHPMIWNIAGDLEINDDPTIQGKLPKFGQFPKKFGFEDDHAAEYYYDKLKKDINKQLQKAGIDECDGSCQNSGGKGDCKGFGHHSPNCGSGAGGEPGPWESEGGAKREGLSKVDADIIRGQTAEAIEEHERSHGRGSVPGDLSRWAKRFNKPKIDWRNELRRHVRASIGTIKQGMSDYSYRRPSRRQEALRPVIIPGFIEYTPRVAIVVDTSGSMGTAELQAAMAEVDGVLTGLGQPCTVLSVDAEVHTVKKVFDAKQIKLVGGGGTDMTRGIEAACALPSPPHLTIVLTDGYTPWPAERPPRMIVIIGIVNPPEGNPIPTPDWAIRIDIKEKKGKEAEESW
jgi:predicted metal-dependent peptidase